MKMPSQDNQSQPKKQVFSKHLSENKKMLQSYLGDSVDVQMTQFNIKISKRQHVGGMLVVIDGLVDEDAKRNNILKPLMEPPKIERENPDFEHIKSRLTVKEVEVEELLISAIDNVLKSRALLLIEGFTKGLIASIEGYEIRAIEEPETERTVRGAREGFIESLSVNLSLIRRRVRNPALRFETMDIGDFSQTGVTIGYVKDIADPELVKRCKKRLEEIKVDTIHNSGDIEQFIEDHPYSFFSTIGNTERPDLAATLLMEGRIVILIDGDPTVLYAPNLFVENLKNIEDYNSRPYYTSFIRILRFIALFISISLPALFISTVNFNKALIPSDMIVPLTEAREAVPFPLALEVMMMILIFEIVRESGLRLPKQVGTAITIVGPLILGEVAVTSSLVGAPTVIIVSISYIASFVITPIADVTALLRIGVFLASAVFGAYGMLIAMLALLSHMVSLTSLGVPYMAPLAPFHFRDWGNAFIRLPTRFLKYRDKSIPHQRSKRMTSVPNTGDKK